MAAAIDLIFIMDSPNSDPMQASERRSPTGCTEFPDCDINFPKWQDISVNGRRPTGFAPAEPGCGRRSVGCGPFSRFAAQFSKIAKIS
jgi:hypothetical protein